MKFLLSNIDLIAIFQALILFIALIFKKENKSANRIIALIILFVGIDFIEKYLLSRGLFKVFPYYPWGSIHFIYFYSPALYIYTKLITGTETKLNKKNMLHFIPLLLVFCINAVYYFSIDFNNTELVEHLVFSHKISFEKIIFRVIEISYFLLYTIITLLLINSYSQKIKNFYSNTGRINLLWLKFLIFFQILIELSLNAAFFTYRHESIINIFHVTASVLGLIILFLISIFSIIQPEMINKNAFSDMQKDESDASYKKFRMGERTEKKYAEKLIEIMESEKPYLNEDINLKSLADRLDLSVHQLSMILSLHIKNNFFSFINKYRIDEAKSMLTSPEFSDHNILHIAYNVGFNSKSAFNSMFKKHTGLTPSEFRQKQK